MSVYMIIEIQVEDEWLYAEYVEKVRAIVEAHGGRYLVRGGVVTPLSGSNSQYGSFCREFSELPQEN